MTWAFSAATTGWLDGASGMAVWMVVSGDSERDSRTSWFRMDSIVACGVGELSRM